MVLNGEVPQKFPRVSSIRVGGARRARKEGDARGKAWDEKGDPDLNGG